MDRELTDKEKEEKGSYRPSRKYRSYEPLKVSYQKAITWSVLFALLILTPLVDRGINSLISLVAVEVNTEPTISSESSEEPVIQVYAARTWGAKGMLAVHSWIAMKRAGEERFEVSQVIGWRQNRSGTVLFRETQVPVDSWWGKKATLLLDLRGDQAESIMDKVDTAISAYPWKNEYTLFPGPNSNTFVAWVGLQVPELGLDLPSTAIGKDWRPLGHSLGFSASGTGVQASLFGLLGTSIGLEEGLEINVLGLNFELDLFDLAFEIPLFGRFNLWYLLVYAIIWFFARKLVRNAETKYFYLT